MFQLPNIIKNIVQKLFDSVKDILLLILSIRD